MCIARCAFNRTSVCITVLSNVFMAKMVGFIKLYFPVFLLGAIFGKVVEITGIAEKSLKLLSVLSV